MLLTLADLGVKHVCLYGPANTAAYLTATRHYAIRSSMRVDVTEFNAAASEFSDVNVRVQALCLQHERERQAQQQQAQPQTHTDNNCSDAIAASIPSTPYHVLCYLVSYHSLPGKFHPERAKALGVPVGPLFAQLKGGKSVTFTRASDGTQVTVTPEQVVEPTVPGPAFAIVDVPNRDYLQSCVTHPAWSAYQTTSQQQHTRNTTTSTPAAANLPNLPHSPVHVIYHFTPHSLLTHPDYLSFLHSFPSSVQHIFLNATQAAPCTQLFRGSALQYMKLQLLQSQLFPAAIDVVQQPEPIAVQQQREATNSSKWFGQRGTLQL